MDWKEIGLKVGFEIHQQLDTHKLFCECPSQIRNDSPDFIIKRRLRPVAGELGDVDIAAQFEKLRNKDIVYEVYEENDCLVDIDEEPPHNLNEEALKIALQIAYLLNMEPLREIHVMRKTVVDGSSPFGFQRTALIALNGFIESKEGKVRITSLCLEEDAGRLIRSNEKEIVYRLDRLGIPLVEIRTEPDIKTPEQAREVAEIIGSILRSAKVKRGLGTIRQDVNVSIKEGERVEIKGAQNLDLIPKIVELEARRQMELLKIKKELEKRGFNKINPKIVEITDIFKNTNCKFIKKAIEEGERVFAIKVDKFKGILGWKINPNRRFGTELADIAKRFGLRGIIHGDELPNYGINKEIKEIKKILDCKENDSFLFVVGKEEICKIVLEEIIKRINYAIKGVPKEVRKANEDGTTSFLRPMPGSSRMYPETDLFPIILREKYLEKIKKNLPERFDLKIKRISKEYNIEENLVKDLLKKFDIEKFLKDFKNIKPSIIVKILKSDKEIKKEGGLPENLCEEDYYVVLKYLNDGKIVKEAVPKILAEWSKNKKNLDELITKLDLWKINKKEAEKIIKEIIKKFEGNEKAIINEAMKKLRGKLDGKEIIELINKFK